MPTILRQPSGNSFQSTVGGCVPGDWLKFGQDRGDWLEFGQDRTGVPGRRSTLSLPSPAAATHPPISFRSVLVSISSQFPTPSHPSHPVPSRSVPFRPVPSRSVPSRPIPSCSVLTRPVLFQPIHPIPFRLHPSLSHPVHSCPISTPSRLLSRPVPSSQADRAAPPVECHWLSSLHCAGDAARMKMSRPRRERQGDWREYSAGPADGDRGTEIEGDGRQGGQTPCRPAHTS